MLLLLLLLLPGRGGPSCWLLTAPSHHSPTPLKACRPLSVTSNAPTAGLHTAAARPFLEG
jgi:hypothetical protein